MLDRVEGAGKHRLRSTLPLAGGSPPVASLGEPVLSEEAWLSERFGERLPIVNAVVEVDAELPYELGWEIRLAR